MKLREKNSAGEETVGKMHLFLWCLFLNSQKKLFWSCYTHAKVVQKNFIHDEIWEMWESGDTKVF